MNIILLCYHTTMLNVSKIRLIYNGFIIPYQVETVNKKEYYSYYAYRQLTILQGIHGLSTNVHVIECVLDFT